MKFLSKVLLGLIGLSFLFSIGQSSAKPWQDLSRYTQLLRWVERGILDLNEIKPLSGDMAGEVLDPRDPDIAYDPTNNRYLMVWEEEISPGNFQIMGRFRNPDGSPVGTSDVRISVDRPSHGCFYDTFDADNGDITTPTSCVNKNPSVAYNIGQFLIAWEVQGAASAPSTAPDNEFSNIFVSIVDANTLNPLPNFAEGLLFSFIQIAANTFESGCGKNACNDSQILAWGKAHNPDVAPRIGGAGGFVVTWDTNKDFVGCSDPARRSSTSVYGRYIDQNFSYAAGAPPNPAYFVVYQDDSVPMDKCEQPSSVEKGLKPRIAFNEMTNDFVVAYEVSRASGGNASIGAKRVTLNAQNVGEVSGSMMPNILATVDGSSLTSPDVVSFRDNYFLFVSDGANIRAKNFSSGSIAPTAPDVIDLGSGDKVSPRASSNLGATGRRPGGNSDPELLVVAYEQGGDIRVAVLNDSLAVTKGPINVSTGIATENRAVEVASDYHDFVTVWHGQNSGDKVFAAFVDSTDTSNPPPTAPGLLTPANGTTFPPTRAYLSWNASTDPDGGTVTYNVYFGESVLPATPQATGLTATEFVIGPETQATTGITLQPSRTYQWKIEAVDNEGQGTSSGTRTLNTDNSVVAWYRFNEDPMGSTCPGGAGGETICDSSGNNNHGIPMSGPTWLPPPMPGILQGALDFDGMDDWVEVANAGNLNFGNGTSIGIEVRINPTTITFPTAWVLGKGTSGAHGNYNIFLNQPTNQVGFTFQDIASALQPTYMSNLTITIGTWSHVIVTHTFGNGGSTNMKINGVAVAGTWTNSDGMPTANGNEAPTVIALPLSVGRRTTLSQNHYDGIVDEAILYNNILDNTFMQNAYNSTF